MLATSANRLQRTIILGNLEIHKKNFPACLALWLRWREWRVLLLHSLLLRLTPLGQVFASELGQEPLPALRTQFRVFGQLPFDHQCLRKNGNDKLYFKPFFFALSPPPLCPQLQVVQPFAFNPREIDFRSQSQEQGWKTSSWGINTAGIFQLGCLFFSAVTLMLQMG